MEISIKDSKDVAERIKLAEKLGGRKLSLKRAQRVLKTVTLRVQKEVLERRRTSEGDGQGMGSGRGERGESSGKNIHVWI